MGDFFGGGGGGAQQVTSSSTTPDPTSQALRLLYGQGIQEVRGATGGLGPFFNPPSAVTTLNPQEAGFRDLLMSAATGGPGFAAGYGALPILQAIIGQSLQPLDASFGQAGLETMRGRTDPTALLTAAQDYMTRIAEPSMRAASVAGGMGGVKGGAHQDALARAGAGLALPIAQMVQGATGEYGQAQLGLDALRETFGRERAGLGGQLATTAATLGPGLDQTRMGMLQQGIQAAGLPRILGMQDFLRQQNLAAAALLGIPVVGGQTTTGTQTGQVNQDLTLMGLMQALGPALGIGLGTYLRR